MVQLKFGLVISDLVKNLGLMEQNGYDGPFLAYAKEFTVTNFTNHPFFLLEMLKQECCTDMVIL